MAAAISVVICAFSDDRFEALAAAIRSLEKQTAPPSEVILVVDNNRALAARARAEFRGVTVIEHEGVRGAGAARNTGASRARGAVIAFMDDDAKAVPDWLALLSEHYRDSRTLGVGGAIRPSWQVARPRWFPEEFDWVVGCTYRGMPSAPSPVRNLIAANMSLRRDVLLSLGGFRPGLGKCGGRSGTEETELCIRARQRWPAGVWLYHPKARVYHRVPAERATWRYFVLRCYDEGRAKARVARLVGHREGLASERAHVVRVLPAAIARGLQDAVRRADPFGVARAAAVALGFAAAVAGYLIGVAVRAWPPR